ncbi:MAG: hypothetical protein ACRYFU_12905, partial [Janthinobacterium lividum]
FNLVAQSGFRLQHVDVFSLPVFLDGLFSTRTPDWIYLLPTLAILALSLLVPRIDEKSTRRLCALCLVMAASLVFFLSYPTVWEYQYTAVLPLAAVLLLLPHSAVLSRQARAWSVGLASCAALPSLYFLSGNANPSDGTLALIRLDRVVPVTLLFGLLLWIVTRAVIASVNASPQRLFVIAPRQDYSSPAADQA